MAVWLIVWCHSEPTQTNSVVVNMEAVWSSETSGRLTTLWCQNAKQTAISCLSLWLQVLQLAFLSATRRWPHNVGRKVFTVLKLCLLKLIALIRVLYAVTLVLSLTNSLAVQIQSIYQTSHDLGPFFGGAQLLNFLAVFRCLFWQTSGQDIEQTMAASFPVL